MMPTAIIVDDYDDLADVLEHYLKLLGITTVAKGRNGMEAFQLYRVHEPDFVYLDVSMPEYDGFFALEKIKKHYPLARIVITTGDTSDQTRRKLRLLGASEILYKPIESQMLKNTVERAKLDLINLA